MIHRALQRAREVAAQVEATRAPDVMLAAATLRRPALEKTPDEGLTVAAMERIEQSLRDPTVDAATALSIVQQAAPPWAVVQPIAERLVARGPLDGAALGFVKHVLCERVPHFTLDVVPDLASAFGGVPELSRDLAAALLKADDTSLVAAVLAARARSGDAGEGVFEAWVVALLEAKKHAAIASLDDDALFRSAVQIVFATCPASTVLAVYCGLACPEQSAILLDELARHPLRTTPAMREAFEATREWREDADNAVEAGWLAACVAAVG